MSADNTEKLVALAPCLVVALEKAVAGEAWRRFVQDWPDIVTRLGECAFKLKVGA